MEFVREGVEGGGEVGDERDPQNGADHREPREQDADRPGDLLVEARDQIAHRGGRSLLEGGDVERAHQRALLDDGRAQRGVEEDDGRDGGDERRVVRRRLPLRIDTVHAGRLGRPERRELTELAVRLALRAAVERGAPLERRAHRFAQNRPLGRLKRVALHARGLDQHARRLHCRGCIETQDVVRWPQPLGDAQPHRAEGGTVFTRDEVDRFNFKKRRAVARPQRRRVVVPAQLAAQRAGHAHAASQGHPGGAAR